MAEYISRDVVIIEFMDNDIDHIQAPNGKEAVQILSDIPAADVVPVRHGEHDLEQIKEEELGIQGYFKIGEEVIDADGTKAVILRVSEDNYCQVYTENGCIENWHIHTYKFHKTGKTYPEVGNMLENMRREKEEEIQVGDEVVGTYTGEEETEPFVIIRKIPEIYPNYYFGIYSKSGEFCQGGLKLKKTGRTHSAVHPAELAWMATV